MNKKDEKMHTSKPTNDGKKWWQSSNFWTNIVLFLSGLFVGFPQGEAATAVASVFALIASGKLLYNYFKSGVKFDFKSWAGNLNNRGYLATLIVSIFPAFNSELLSPVWDAMRALLDQNWQGLLVAVITFVNMIWNISRPKIRNMLSVSLDE